MIRYVSAAGSDANVGTTEAAPWATVDRVNAALLAGEIRQGDVVLFRRGDTFYGKLNLSAGNTGFTQAGDYCTFGSYGQRKAKPIISGYKLLNTSGGWTLHAAGIWKLDVTNLASFTGYQNITPSVGGSQPDGTNIGHLLINGVLYGGRKFGASLAAGLAALSAQWDFYSDNAQWLYVKSTANPTTLAADIRAATDGTAVVLGNSLRILGLRIEGSGGHHFGGNAKHVRLYGNEGGPGGGSYLTSTGNGTTRYGNGVELSIGADDFEGTHNTLEDIYDVGFTMQGPKSSGRIGWTNCYWRHNRQQRCSQNLEFWSQGVAEAGSGAVDCAVQKNEFGSTINRWTLNGWRPGGVAGSRHQLFHDWTLGAARFSIDDNSFYDQPAGGSYHYMETPPAGVTIDNNRVFLPAGSKLSGHSGEAGSGALTYTVEQAAAWKAAVGTELNTQFFVLPTDPTDAFSAVDQISADTVRGGSRAVDVQRALATLAADLERGLAIARDAATRPTVYQTLTSSAGTQFARIATLKMSGTNDKTVATFLVSEAGDQSLAMGTAIVRVGMHAGGSNNVRVNVAVTELIPFNRAGAERGAGPWFKAENFVTRLAATDNAFAHEIAVHFKLSDSFQGIQFTPLTEFKSAGTVRYYDQEAVTGSVPADYSTGAPTVIKTYRFTPASPTSTDIAYSTPITPPASDAELFNIGALTGALVMNAPTGVSGSQLYDGQRMTFRFTQDATGGRVITWNAAYAFGTDYTAAMIPTTGNAKCEVEFRYCAADTKWRCVGIARGF